MNHDRRSGTLRWTRPDRHRSRAACLLAAGLAAFAAGCSDDDDDDSSSSSASSITIKEEHDWSFDDNDYSWNSPGPVARVSLEIDDFHHGDMLVTIRDALGIVIYSKLYWSFDWYWYIDGEYSDVDFTDPGVPGLWTIILEFSEFTGDVVLVVETTSETPPDPVVPQPPANSELLDLSFGHNGRAEYEPGTTGGRRVAVDSQGRILTCGTLVGDDGSRRLTVWRHTAGGDLDGSFGDGGVVTYDNSTLFATGALDVAVDGNDRVVVGGWVAPAADRRTDLAVFRFTTAGKLDPNFSSDGIVFLDQGEDEAATAVAIDTGTRVVVAGTSRVQDNTSGHVLLIRLNSLGGFDGTLGGDGIVETTDATDRSRDVALASGDQPLVLGTRNGQFILWKFTFGGSLDPSFGTGGMVTSTVLPGEFRVGSAIAVKDDGTLGVTGARYFSDASSPPEMILWRFLADGSPHLPFGGSGFLSYRYPTGWAAGLGIRFDSNSRLVVCGVTRSSNTLETDASATLWRYFSSGSIDTSLPGSSGSGVARFDPRPDNAGTAASSLVPVDDGDFVISGTAFARDTNAVDLVLWKVDP